MSTRQDDGVTPEASDVGMGIALTPEQFSTMVLVERTAAGFSIAAVATIIVTFVLFKKLRTPQNWFLFLAAITNTGAVAGAMIGHDDLKLDEELAMCQLQAVLAQWYIQGDSWFKLGVAFHVCLTLFNLVDHHASRVYVPIWCTVYFGGNCARGVAILAMPSIEAPRLMFGDTGVWCWIDDEWSALRTYSFYTPVWICILLSTTIYISVCLRIFRQRNQLRNCNGLPQSLSAAGNTISVESGATLLSICPTWLSLAFVKRLGDVMFGCSFRSNHLDPVKLTYLRVTSLVAFTQLIAWLPSSLNCIYRFTHNGALNFPLNAISAFFLAMQGVWTASIYFPANWSLLSEEIGAFMVKWIIAASLGRPVISHGGPLDEATNGTSLESRQQPHIELALAEQAGEDSNLRIRETLGEDK